MIWASRPGIVHVNCRTFGVGHRRMERTDLSYKALIICWSLSCPIGRHCQSAFLQSLGSLVSGPPLGTPNYKCRVTSFSSFGPRLWGRAARRRGRLLIVAVQWRQSERLEIQWVLKTA